MKKIAIIPLKSDSKRFIDKNFKCINGKSLLVNTIDKLNEAGVDIIVISTDKKEIVYNNLHSCNYKSIFIIDRPINLMGDAKTEYVVLDTINEIDTLSLSLLEDYIIVLTQVTSPLWNQTKLKMAFSKLNSTDSDSVIGVSPNYMPNGCFYVFKKSTFLQNNKIFTDNSYLITMPWEESVDIDYEHELSIASALERGNYV